MIVANPQQTADTRPVSVLTIAGSDSGGGAGIQADLKTFAAHRVHGLSALAALTAQNTTGVTAVHTPPTAFLRAQLDALFADFRIGAVKVGMLATAEVIDVVADVLAGRPALPVVLDPVMIASSGAALLAPDAVATLRRRLLPRASVLTPNLPEAETLLGRAIAGREAMPAAAEALRALGARAVLLKGGHLADGELLDYFLDDAGARRFVHPRLALEGHGTGCTLASAIAARLALGDTPGDACEQAADYVHGALRHATRPGRGAVVVLDHLWQSRRI
jgi:hydroxymethylpyrimidine/phosphomethylpyrimidine kinase